MMSEHAFYKKSHWQLAIALFTAALDFFHLGLVYPIFAELVMNPNGNFFLGEQEGLRNITYAVFIAAFPLGQFIGSPF